MGQRRADDRHEVTRAPLPARRRPRRALAVRVMAAETAWLDGRLRWHEGRIAWEVAGRMIVPGTADLALAQRRLYKIRRYPVAADLAWGDGQAWLERRQARLALAKRLHAIVAPDLPDLAQASRLHDPAAVQRLVELLLAEALCLNRLPASPAVALCAFGRRADVALRVLLDDDTAPTAARALAALTLGAIHGRSSSAGESTRAVAIPGDAPGFQRAYTWGVRFGLPDNPGLAITLLIEEDGTALMQRYRAAMHSDSPFLLPDDTLRELLAQGVAASAVVALAEAAAAAAPLATRVLQRRDNLPDRRSPQRRVVAAELRRQRRQMLADISDLLHGYARATTDPVAIALLAEFVGATLELSAPPRDPNGAIVEMLRQGLSLPPWLQRPWLELLVAHRERLWDRSTVPVGKKVKNLSDWLQWRHRMFVAPLLGLLRTSGDAAMVHEAVELNVYHVLAEYHWSGPALYRLATASLRDLHMQGDVWSSHQLCRCLNQVGDAAEARALLLPILHSLTPLTREFRNHIAGEIFVVLSRMPQELHVASRQVARFLPRLLQAVSDSDEVCTCRPLLLGALTLYRNVPERADAWLDWLIDFIVERGRVAQWEWEEVERIEPGMTLGVALADGDLGRFQRIVRVVLQHELDQRWATLEQGITLLGRFPALRRTLARLFPEQPRRCTELIVRVGLAARLEREMLAALEELEIEPEVQRDERDEAQGAEQVFLVHAGDDGGGWHEVLALAPQAAAIVARYFHAQWLTGGSYDVPPGVRRAMEQPRKIEREMGYLERTLALHPERADLSVRVHNLRARLSDEEQLVRSVRDEVCDRLEQITAEAELGAAEQQVLACYHARLADVAGPLPAGLRLDEDLLNATLLTVDIKQNRRLLLRLLRAHIAGDDGWRERHPSNAAFLRQLAERGVDVAAWLGAHPRSYRCEGVAGGRVRLHLVRAPLQILQMGNYFDTCLSFGGINAFSTVANACELNKRVIYASDGSGRVVGRKLIGIDAEGRLVGFRTYATVQGGNAGTALVDIFHRYAATFAERCGLQLSDSGTVPTLFAEAWYDDGVVRWDEGLSPRITDQSERPAPHGRT